jgi:hypothetical protein
MGLDEVFSQLRELNEPVPKPSIRPSAEQVALIEKETGVTFHPDLRRFLLEVSDVVYGIKEPITITDPKSHTHFPDLLASAREYGVPQELIPFCEDNSDFYCLDSSGKVLFWSHDGATDESWPDLATWIKDVWIEEG